MPNNRNDQAKAHSQVRESAEERSKITTGEVLLKNRGIRNYLKLILFKNCLTGGI
jgi:hypothetical protein